MIVSCMALPTDAGAALSLRQSEKRPLELAKVLAVPID
jgi:hypothetical protein